MAVHERALRAILDQETPEGRDFLAGIAVSYATGMSEIGGRRLVERATYLRSEENATDGELLLRMQPSRKVGRLL